MVRDPDVAVSNVVEKFISVAIVKRERRLSSQHFVNNCSYTPPVNSSSMAFAIDNFWSEIFGSSTQGLCIIAALNVFFR